MKIRIGVLALADIDAIWLYTREQWSTEQAIKYYNILFDEFDYLSEFPNSGKKAESAGKGYRYSKMKSHIIFYKVDKENGVLEIIRVLHERMNSTQWLSE